MTKHTHHADVKASSAVAYELVETIYGSTVIVSYVHPGALPRVRVSGPGARELRDAVVDIIGRYFSSIGTNVYAMTEIQNIFEVCPDPPRDVLGELEAAVTRAFREARAASE